MKNVSAIVLAAGKGTRLNGGKPSEKPKVLYEVAGKAMILFSLDILKKLEIADVAIVVGHLGDQVKEKVGPGYKFVSQEQASGTGEAVRLGLAHLEKGSDHVLVLYGADIYRKDVIERTISTHLLNFNTVTFLTAEKDDPTGLGRIVRNEKGEIIAIVEEKLATEGQKKIKEVNDGCYIFQKDWLANSISKLKMTKVKEYFLTDLIELAILEGQRLEAFKITTPGWFGVDTPEQLNMTSEFIKNNWKDDGS